MKLNFVDIFVLAIAVLGLLFGLIGRPGKKIVGLVKVAGACVVAYFVYPYVTSALLTIEIQGAPLSSFLTDMIGGAVASMGISADALSGVVIGLLNLIVFWLLCFIAMIPVGIILRIVCFPVFRKPKKGTAVKKPNFLFRLFGAIVNAAKAGVVAVLILFPVLTLAPAMDAVQTFVKDNEIVEIAAEQLSSSKAVEWSGKLIDKTKPAFLTYETEDGGQKTSHFLYSDIKALKGASVLLNIFMPAEGESDPTPEGMISSLKEHSPEELREAIVSLGESDFVKELGNMEMIQNMGIDLANMDFEAEADMLVMVVQIVDVDDSGKFSVNLDNVPTDTIATALVNSDMAKKVAAIAPGMLSDIDEGKKTEIQGKIETALTPAGGEPDTETCKVLMSLFESQSN